MGRLTSAAMVLPVVVSALGGELSPANIGITDVPTVEDCVPIGVVYELADEGSLSDIPDPAWTLSCFILVAVGETRGWPTRSLGSCPGAGC